MASAQTKCFRCYKKLSAENEKAWLKNDGLCPNCATPLSVEDETCYSCNKPAEYPLATPMLNLSLANKGNNL